MKLHFLMLAAACVLTAQPKQEKRSAGAHEHGAAKLDIAMEGLKGSLVFEVPMESLTGFEHEAKTAADKKKMADAEAALRSKMGQMVLLPATAACSITVTEVEAERHGGHSEMHVRGAIACKQPLTGDIRFAFGKVFPGIHKVAVQFVDDAIQTGVVVEHDRVVLKVAK